MPRPVDLYFGVLLAGHRSALRQVQRAGVHAMGLFGKGKKKKGQNTAPAINPGPLGKVPTELPEVTPGEAGSTFRTSGPPPILAPDAMLAQTGASKPAAALPKTAAQSRTATLRPTPVPTHDLVDLSTADDDVLNDSDDPSNSATGQLKVALHEQGVDSGQQVMDLLEQIEKQLGQLQHLRTERKTFMADLDKRSAELASRESDIKALEEEARENHRIVDQLKNQADQDADTLKREKSAVEASRQLLDAQRRTLDAHQNALGEQRDKVEQEEKALEEARAELAKIQDASQHAIAALEERDAELAELRAKTEAFESGDDAAQERASQLEDELATANTALEDAQTQLDSLRDQSTHEHDESLAKASQDIEQRDREIENLTKMLDEATQPGAEAPPVNADEFNATRRARLALVRSELNNRARKLHMAHDQLQERKRQIDQKAASLSAAGPMSGVGETQRTMKGERQQLVDYAEALRGERTKILTLKNQVQRSAKRTESRVAAHRASTMLFAIVGSLAVIAGGSWIAANRFSEATYLASVSIAADPADGQATTRQLESWTRAHETMINDPQFHEKAADRLRSRGIRDLATPIGVAEYVKHNLSVESGEPGQITLTVTGVGAPRTERVLESFAAAVAAQGNASRDFRADALPTVVASAALVDPIPVDDPRLELFGMIFGGASAVLLFGGLILWRRIASDQQAFEEKIKMTESDFEDVLPPPMTNIMQSNGQGQAAGISAS